MIKRLDTAVSCPVHDGFLMPGEWRKHRRSWMCWPTRRASFGNQERFLRAKQAYARVARAISSFEPVIIAASKEDVAEARLATGSKPDVVELPIDDSFARDTAPTFLINGKGQTAGVLWRFNGWGGKYHPYANDMAFGLRVLELAGVGAYRAPFVCEGGAIHADGEGTLITTEQCLLNPNRNPDVSREEMETYLTLYLGARKIIWLGSGFADMETDGHIDNIACFAGPGRIILGVPQTKNHPDYDAVQEARRCLKETRDARSRTLEIVELPQPKKMRERWSGGPLPASYVNFYLANNAVIMPAFDDASDETARAIVADCFPGADIMQIDALDIVQGGGGIHCITQQEPDAWAL